MTSSIRQRNVSREWVPTSPPQPFRLQQSQVWEMDMRRFFETVLAEPESSTTISGAVTGHGGREKRAKAQRLEIIKE